MTPGVYFNTGQYTNYRRSSLSIDHIITTLRGLPHSAGCRMSLTSIDLVIMVLIINCCNQTKPYS